MIVLKDTLIEIATEHGLEPELVYAIICVETNHNQWACRYEPKWRYFFEVDEWALKLGQSPETEHIQQATSWGLMQVMGTVARELGFMGYLSQLSVAEIGARMGCMKLQQLFKKYVEVEDVIAAYNAGSARRSATGKYLNQEYVDKVMKVLKKVRGE